MPQDKILPFTKTSELIFHKYSREILTLHEDHHVKLILH